MPIYRVPVEIRYGQSGSPGVNVWHCRTTSEWTTDTTELQGAVTALRTFYSSIASLYGAGTLLDLGQVVNVDTQSIATPTFNQVSGSGASGYAPTPLQVCVSWRTSIAARRGMGRTFIGPLSTAMMQSDSLPSATGLTTLRDACQALVDASTASNFWGWGVYGLETAAPPLTEDYSALPRVLRDFTTFSVKNQFAVLRSRRD